MIMPHPIDQFQPPRSIKTGQPLKNLLDQHLLRLLAESMQQVHASFPVQQFLAAASENIDDLELTPRAQHIAQALIAALPSQPDAALAVLRRSFGPPIVSTAQIGMQPFFYLPHSHVVALLGPQDVAAGLQTCYELTQCFTAEFAIRPLLLAQPEPVLTALRHWSSDASPHVRRLVSEGTRPRLPWAPRLPGFIADPSPCFDLLERLYRDTDRYVQRSVANHLGDLAKDHLDLVLDTCERWLSEARQLSAPAEKKPRKI